MGKREKLVIPLTLHSFAIVFSKRIRYFKMRLNEQYLKPSHVSIVEEQMLPLENKYQ